MEQFVIPQFIDEESHILGPIVVRQFVILLVVGFFIFLAYRFADFALFVVVTVFLSSFGGALAFIRVNGRPFHFFLLNLLQTLQRPNLRIWRKKVTTQDVRDSMVQIDEQAETPLLVTRPKVVGSRLSELSLVVDTGGVYRGDPLKKEN